MASSTTLLLARWQTGDTRALDQLLDEHLPWICAHVQQRLGRLLRGKAEPDDYVQQVCVEFLRYGPRFTLENGAHFRALLGRIAENVLRGNYDWWAARRRDFARERPLPSDSLLNLDPPKKSTPTPSQVVQQGEREAYLRLGLELLRPPERESIVLRDYEGLAFAEISKRLNKSEEAARQQYHRAVTSLSRTVGALRRGQLDAVLSADDSE